MTEISGQRGAGAPGTMPVADANVERTLGLAFALAMRILDDSALAGSACEQAYSAALAAGSVSVAWDRPAELSFLGSVRTQALALKAASPAERSNSGSQPYEPTGPTKMVRDCLEGSEPVGRGAIELCYFGGLSAAEAASVLGEPVERVRAAMRTVLLSLGSTARQSERQRA